MGATKLAGVRRLLQIALAFVCMVWTHSISAQGTSWWIITADGSTENVGAIFKANSIGTNMQMVHEFSPLRYGHTPGGWIQATSSTGMLYGIVGMLPDAPNGNGNYNTIDSSAIVELNPTTGELTPRLIVNGDEFHQWGIETGSNIVEAPDSNLYWYTGSNLVRYNPVTNQLHKLLSVDNFMYGKVIGVNVSANGGLYLTTREYLLEVDLENDTIYTRATLDAATYGKTISSPLLVHSDGKFYGYTIMNEAGTGSQGTLFSFDPATNTLAKEVGLGYKVGPVTWQPMGTLADGGNGKIYGVTEKGGGRDEGMFFEYNPATKAMTEVGMFTTFGGSKPITGLVAGSDGYLYGTTRYGGGVTVATENEQGSFYRFNPSDYTYDGQSYFNSNNDKGTYRSGCLIEARNCHQVSRISDVGCFSYTTANNSVYDSTGSYTEQIDLGNGCIAYYNYDIFISKVYGDLNCNGQLDAGEIAGDIDASGVIEGAELAGDFNGNGVYDEGELAGDLNGDGAFNGEELAGDLNGDGQFSGDELAGDSNGNGLFDSSEIAGDVSGNGMIDGAEIAGDANGSGSIESPEYAGDNNGDGIFDDTELVGDVNGNGAYDDNELAGDLDGNGIINGTAEINLVGAPFWLVHTSKYVNGVQEYGGIFKALSTGDSIVAIQKFSNITAASGLYNGLVKADSTNGLLYGLLEDRGAGNKGGIFEFNPYQETYRMAYEWTATDLAKHSRYCQLIQGADGRLYGHSEAVIYSFNPANNSYRELYQVDTDELRGDIKGGLCWGSNGLLYGITYGTTSGSEFIAGSIFSLNPQTLEFSSASVGGTNFTVNLGGPVEYEQGEFAVAMGTKNEQGGILLFDEKLGFSSAGASFSQWQVPLGQVTVVDGTPYGITSRGGNGKGGLLRYTSTFNSSTPIHTFVTDDEIAGKTGYLLDGQNGRIYGVASVGSTGNAGTIFAYDLDNSQHKIIARLPKTSVNEPNPGIPVRIGLCDSYVDVSDSVCGQYESSHTGSVFYTTGTYFERDTVEGCVTFYRYDLTISGLAGDINCDEKYTDGEIAGDIDQNGVIDGDEIAGDINGNGKIDISERTGDTNGDRFISLGEIHGDANGNGALDEGEEVGTELSTNTFVMYPVGYDGLPLYEFIIEEATYKTKASIDIEMASTLPHLNLGDVVLQFSYSVGDTLFTDTATVQGEALVNNTYLFSRGYDLTRIDEEFKLSVSVLSPNGADKLIYSYDEATVSGVEERQAIAEVDLQIAPNPFTNRLIVRSASLPIHTMHFQLFNLLGQSVPFEAMKLDDESLEIRISSDLPTGHYLLKTHVNQRHLGYKIMKR